MKSVKYIITLFVALSVASPNTIAVESNSWKQVLTEQIALLGHRNWIVVADSAYPQQSNSGIQTVLSDQSHEQTIQWVKELIDSQSHVKPVVHLDEEIDFLDDSELEGLEGFRQFLNEAFGAQSTNKLIHEDIIKKLDDASNLFNIIVIKTGYTIPYTSVFFELDCKYWNSESERKLRANIQK